ncbi:AAA family ATPase [Hydrogenophaga sp. D2P1]|uniref:AAA family ATPase n=1 Tax=Hydrogenophaga aromaticivorans TaxID=2610898 RepID=A0A7Y8L0G3_9BURK|nr:UvrD-helicase domain-containing protein [Hydrogenophaga aromaticivorans]NWF48133.1 AAA family ATPase [Hydrogenophaga aromaticivorans]
MIKIIGAEGSDEYAAAEKVKEEFEKFLDPINCRKSDIRIVVSAKTYGEKRQDIDLVVAGFLSTRVEIPKSRTVTSQVFVKSFFLTIEVKNHRFNSIQFSGPKVFVRYKDRREDASEQAEEQKYSALEYIRKHRIEVPYILSILMLNNVPKSHLPSQRHNIIAGDFDLQDILEIIYIAQERRLSSGNKVFQAFRQDEASAYLQVVDLFCKKLELTQLDRKRIEITTKKSFDQKFARENLGKQLLVIRGAGGTGKTVTLLQLAQYVYQELNAKALILTYNLALVSDIRRLMALIGMSDDIATAKVAVSTVHSFVYKILDIAGMAPGKDNQFLHNYADLKASLLSAIGAMDKSELEPWDYIFIDEGQDWPEDERDIVFNLYGIPNVVVAEGRSQLVRSRSLCDWTTFRSLPLKYESVTYTRSLRMKHDQCKYVIKLIDALGLTDWKISPNVEIFGGRVIIAIGDLSVDQKLIDSVISSAKRDGNKEVDLFVCVPPSFVEKRSIRRLNRFNGREELFVEKFSPLGDTLRDYGYAVWDGVDEEERQSFPTNVHQLRLVQYDSCRGLEGWAVINFAIDELYDYKKENFEPTPLEKSDFLFDHDASADNFAKKWLAIPMTRAIDTLVLNVKDPSHWLVDVLIAAADGSPAVEVVRCSATQGLVV